MSESHDDEIIRHTLDIEGDNPAMQLVEVVAEAEETDPVSLTSIWGCIDDVLDNIFSNPPSPEAQLELSFSYEGYRIEISQDGVAELMQV